MLLLWERLGWSSDARMHGWDGGSLTTVMLKTYSRSKGKAAMRSTKNQVAR